MKWQPGAKGSCYLVQAPSSQSELRTSAFTSPDLRSLVPGFEEKIKTCKGLRVVGWAGAVTLNS